jgi:hypothetical protein
MEGIKAFLKGEPVAVTAVITAGIACAAAFGFELSAEQVAGIVTVVAALSGLFARSKVSPTE